MPERTVRDRGFTLPEVMITILMISLITTALAAAVLVVMRSRPAVEARTDDARSYQGLVTWLPRDVASTPDDSANIIEYPASTSLLCSGAEVISGSNMLELRWVEDNGGGPVQFVAAYRFEDQTGGRVVRRHTCSSDASYTNTTSINLTSVLDAATANVDTSGNSVSVDFTTASGEPYVVGGKPILVRASSRNPNATLPPATTPATNPPLTPCAVAFTPAIYGPQELFDPPPANRADKLRADVTLTLSVTGDTCGTITIGYNTGIESKTRTVTVVGTVGTATLPQGTNNASTPKWVPGVHSIQAFNGAVPIGAPASLEVFT